MNNSISLLQEAANKLRDILTVKFNEAVADEDIASVERFFKLFPLLNMHDYGLEKFSLFLSTKVKFVSCLFIKLVLFSLEIYCQQIKSYYLRL